MRKFFTWLMTPRMSKAERYYSGAVDHVDLERRMQRVKRHPTFYI